MAVQCGMYPLYEVENGKYIISVDFENLKPVNDYLKSQGRFRHLSDNEIAHIQNRVNWEWTRLKDLAGIPDHLPGMAG